MNLRVRTWRHVLVYGMLVVILAVAVPVALVKFFLPPFIPFFVQVPIYIVAILVPLLIAAPVAIFGLYMFKRINQTIDALDRHVKFDHLTGLLSRNYFLSSAELGRAKGGMVLMIDADHFKRINDTFGHDGGDEALKAIARIVQHTAAPLGLAGRLGGEEFAIYAPRTTRAQAAELAHAVLQTVRTHQLQLDGKLVPLSVSIGIAEDSANSTLAQALKAADTALYAAKAQGRDRMVFASDTQPVLGVAA